MPYITNETSDRIECYSAKDNCMYIPKERPVPVRSTKELEFDDLTGKTPCDKCSHSFVCGKKDEYRKSVEDIIATLGDAPEFLHILVVCGYFDIYKR